MNDHQWRAQRLSQVLEQVQQRYRIASPGNSHTHTVTRANHPMTANRGQNAIGKSRMHRFKQANLSLLW
jgi:hypothetical protein